MALVEARRLGLCSGTSSYTSSASNATGLGLGQPVADRAHERLGPGLDETSDPEIRVDERGRRLRRNASRRRASLTTESAATHRITDAIRVRITDVLIVAPSAEMVGRAQDADRGLDEPSQRACTRPAQSLATR